MQMYDIVSVMSQNHGIKGGTFDEPFQEKCCLWESGASVGVNFDLFNVKELLQAQERCKFWGFANKQYIFKSAPNVTLLIRVLAWRH